MATFKGNEIPLLNLVYILCIGSRIVIG